MDRRCGSCTLCCKLTSVPELGKPINVWCKHCVVGKGCGIYDARPTSCQQFKCVWYENLSMSNELRPDVCKVVFEGIGNKIVLALINQGADWQVWSNPAIRAQVREFLRESIALVDTHQRRVMLPKGRTEAEVSGYIREFAVNVGLLRKVENGSTVIHD